MVYLSWGGGLLQAYTNNIIGAMQRIIGVTLPRIGKP